MYLTLYTSIHSTELEVLYSFDLNLFSEVKTDLYDTKITGGEVLITLYKETPSVKWRRLTKSKTKVSLNHAVWNETTCVCERRSRFNHSFLITLYKETPSVNREKTDKIKDKGKFESPCMNLGNGTTCVCERRSWFNHSFLITLCKETPSVKWRRLTKSKTKVSLNHPV